MFLIDTAVVLSELRRRERDPGVVAWISSQRQEDCFLSVVSIGEIERGIARQRADDAGFAAQLAGWLDQLLRLHGDRLLPVDLSVARRWGLLSASIGHHGAERSSLNRALASCTGQIAIPAPGPDSCCCGPQPECRTPCSPCNASGFWSKTCERSLRWSDPEVWVSWPLDRLVGVAPLLADKAADAPTFAEALAAGEGFG